MAKKMLEAIKFAFAADRVAEKAKAAGQDRNYTTIMAIGERSVGKTATAKVAAREIAQALGKKFVESTTPGADEFGYVVADLSGDTAESIAGLFDTSSGDTVVLPHTWWPKSGQGILVFDEFNRIQSTAAPVLQQMADKHKLGPHYMPDGWTAVFIGNPPESGDGEAYMVNDGFDESFYSRFCIIPVEVTRDAWIEFALSAGLNSRVVDYVSSSDEVLKKPKKGINCEEMFPIKPSPRSLETVANILEGQEMALPIFGCVDLTTKDGESMLAHMASGCLGKADAMGFIRSMTIQDKPLSAEDVLENYGAKGPNGKTPQQMIQKWSDLANGSGQAVLAHVTLERVIQAIKTLDISDKKVKDHFEKFQLKNLDGFLGDVRQEEVIVFIRKLQQEVGPRGVEVLKVLQKHNKRVLDGLKDSQQPAMAGV